MTEKKSLVDKVTVNTSTSPGGTVFSVGLRNIAPDQEATNAGTT
jgi:hypothetical protein